MAKRNKSNTVPVKSKEDGEASDDSDEPFKKQPTSSKNPIKGEDKQSFRKKLKNEMDHELLTLS